MKNVFYSLMILSLFFLACETDESYTINGTITGTDSEALYLDYLSMSGNNETLDTVTVGENGNFTFTGLVKEKGFHRIRTKDNKFWIFLLGNQYELKVELDASDQTLQTFNIAGNKEAEAFHDAIKFVQAQQNILLPYQQQMQALQMQQAGMDTILQVQEAMKQKVEQVTATIKDKAGEVNSPFSKLYLLNFVDMTANYNFVKNEVDKIADKLPESSYVSAMRDRLKQAEAQAKQLELKAEMAKKTAIGMEAPEIEMKNPQGQDLKLSDLRGKVVLIDFWASWCKPCRMENPNLVKAYNKFKDRGFTVFSVSLDKNRDAWINAIKADNLSWEHHVSDLKAWQNAAAKEYGVSGIPAAFLIDKEGKIIAKDGLRGAQLENTLEKLL